MPARPPDDREARKRGAGVKVAIVGLSGDGSNVPWDDPSWEVWGLNGAHLRDGLFRRPDGTLRADAWFQLHPPGCLDACEIDWMDLLDGGRIGSCVPTYVLPDHLAHWQERYPRADALGMLLPYPLADIRSAFQGGWFANTFCLEVALALHRGATDIALYGTDCCGYGRELAVERPALAFWMGVVAASGTTLTNGCATFGYGAANPVYGADYLDEARAAARLTELILSDRRELDTENLDTLSAVEAVAGAL